MNIKTVKKFTVAFWVKATKTGTNILELHDQVNDRSVSATYTISTTNTWEHKVVTFPADTTGNFGTGSDLGLIVRYYIYAGANYQSSSLQTVWGSANTTKRANGQVNNADSTSNNWHLTGVQIEVGEFSSTTISPFQHEDFGDSLIRCQRYFQQYGSNNAIYNITPVNGHAMLLGARDTGGNANWTYPVLYQSTPLRANPTISRNDLDWWSGGTAYGISGLGGNQYAGFNALEGYVSGTTFSENVVLLKINGTQHTYLRFDAEL